MLTLGVLTKKKHVQIYLDLFRNLSKSREVYTNQYQSISRMISELCRPFPNCFPNYLLIQCYHGLFPNFYRDLVILFRKLSTTTSYVKFPRLVSLIINKLRRVLPVRFVYYLQIWQVYLDFFPKSFPHLAEVYSDLFLRLYPDLFPQYPTGSAELTRSVSSAFY